MKVDQRGLLPVFIIISLAIFLIGFGIVWYKIRPINTVVPAGTPVTTETPGSATPSATQTTKPSATPKPSTTAKTATPTSAPQQTNTPQGQSGFRLDSISPNPGNYMQQVTVKGSGFGSSGGHVAWYYNGAEGGYVPASSWTDSQIVLTAPTFGSGLQYQVSVIRSDNSESNKIPFQNQQGQPQMQSISPTNPAPNTQVTINGRQFGSGSGSVTIGGKTGSIISWTDSQIIATIPDTLGGGQQYQAIITASNGISHSSVWFITLGN